MQNPGLTFLKFAVEPGNRLFGIHKAWKCVFRGFSDPLLVSSSRERCKAPMEEISIFFNFRHFFLLNRLILGHFYKFRYFFNMRLTSLMVHKKFMYFYITIDA